MLITLLSFGRVLKDKDDTIKIHIENVLESKMDHLIELIDA